MDGLKDRQINEIIHSFRVKTYGMIYLPVPCDVLLKTVIFIMVYVCLLQNLLQILTSKLYDRPFFEEYTFIFMERCCQMSWSNFQVHLSCHWTDSSRQKAKSLHHVRIQYQRGTKEHFILNQKLPVPPLISSQVFFTILSSTSVFVLRHWSLWPEKGGG